MGLPTLGRGLVPQRRPAEPSTGALATMASVVQYIAPSAREYAVIDSYPQALIDFQRVIWDLPSRPPLRDAITYP